MFQFSLARKIIISIILILGLGYASAQNSKIAIISLEDTTLVNQHVGLTMFGNFTDTLHLNIAVSQHIEQQLLKYLSQNYDVSIIKRLPDSVYYPKKSIFGTVGGLSKAVKGWLSSVKNDYNFVIFLGNTSIPREWNILVPENTSGLYTRGSHSGFYTTITFFAYRTADLQRIEYFLPPSKIITPLKKFEFPADNKSFTAEMLVTIKDGFINHIDSVVEYFLTKTYLVPQNQLDEIKAKNS